MKNNWQRLISLQVYRYIPANSYPSPNMGIKILSYNISDVYLRKVRGHRQCNMWYTVYVHGIVEVTTKQQFKFSCNTSSTFRATEISLSGHFWARKYGNPVRYCTCYPDKIMSMNTKYRVRNTVYTSKNSAWLKNTLTRHTPFLQTKFYKLDWT